MKKSITFKLYIGMSGLILLYIGLTYIANTLFFEPYYISQKRQMLIKNSEDIDRQYSGDSKNIAAFIELLESKSGLLAVIVSPNKDIKYITIYPSEKRTRSMLLNHSSFVEKSRETVNEGLWLETIRDRHRRDFLILERQLKYGDTLLLGIPLSSIAESVDIANNFIMYTGLVVIILGSFWMVIFSKRYTKPILELKNITCSMANLDFTQKCNIKNSDEIGELGKSINILSNQLDLAIQELHEKNNKLTEDIKKEKKIDEIRKEFVSNVSHELKTPIALILGYAEGLKENVIDSEENKNFYCEVIIDEARKMDKLVKDLLNLAQMEAGNMMMEMSAFNLSVLIEQVLNKYKGLLEEKEISLSLEVNKNANVYADSTRVEQVLINYINNAIRHVDDDKHITIRTENIKDKVRVFVINSGKHIPEDEIEKIWMSFYKADKARTREDGRIGLGLAIVKAIQERHQNVYGVENVEEGVSFWFDIDKPEILES